MADAEGRGGFDEIWCLGDVVGYGPDVSECIDFVRSSIDVCVAGNHDLAAAGVTDTSLFNTLAARAIAWTRSQLSETGRFYLANLPMKAEKSSFTLVHGSPRDPVWEYILSADSADASFSAFRTSSCLVGHSHVPLAYSSGRVHAKQMDPRAGVPLELGKGRHILNPGAVGQPRDGDPRASYAVVDTEKRQFTLRRVAYDVAAVQQRMRAQGLPPFLIDRLAMGT